jgi:hypothetical protein
VGAEHAQKGNFYWAENQDLRDLTGATRAHRALIVRAWKPHLAHFMKAINLLPLYEGTVYRGRMDTRQALEKEYYPGRKVRWAGISSCSTDMTTAYKRAASGHGVVMEIKVQNGRQMGNISLYPDESEIILAPGMSFLVVDSIRQRMVLVENEIIMVNRDGHD